MRFAKSRGRNHERGTGIIGIAGAGKGTGVTHMALTIANYLQGVCRKKTAVLEWNEHGDFRRFGIICTGQIRKTECYRIQEVDYYPEADANRLLECVKAEYEQIIIDFGDAKETAYIEFMRCDIMWLLMSFSEWQTEAFWELVKQEEASGMKSWQFFTVFGSEESRIEWNRWRQPKILRVPLSVDAFTITKEMLEWMDTVSDQGSFSGNVSRQGLLKRRRKRVAVEDKKEGVR